MNGWMKGFLILGIVKEYLSLAFTVRMSLEYNDLKIGTSFIRGMSLIVTSKC